MNAEASRLSPTPTADTETGSGGKEVDHIHWHLIYLKISHWHFDRIYSRPLWKTMLNCGKKVHKDTNHSSRPVVVYNDKHNAWKCSRTWGYALWRDPAPLAGCILSATLYSTVYIEAQTEIPFDKNLCSGVEIIYKCTFIGELLPGTGTISQPWSLVSHLLK